MRLAVRGAAAATAMAALPAAAHANGGANLGPEARNMRLLQVQAAFRHGARTPMEGLGDAPARWDAKAQRTYLSSSERRTLCAVSMIHPGEGAAVDPLAHFHTCRTAEPLDGGGLPGMLTRVGLEQSRALGARLRERYVDPQARTSTSVRNGYLLPRAWSSARHLVHPRSTLVERTVFTAGEAPPSPSPWCRVRVGAGP